MRPFLLLVFGCCERRNWSSQSVDYEKKSLAIQLQKARKCLLSTTENKTLGDWYMLKNMLEHLSQLYYVVLKTIHVTWAELSLLFHYFPWLRSILPKVCVIFLQVLYLGTMYVWVFFVLFKSQSANYRNVIWSGTNIFSAKYTWKKKFSVGCRWSCMKTVVYVSLSCCVWETEWSSLSWKIKVRVSEIIQSNNSRNILFYCLLHDCPELQVGRSWCFISVSRHWKLR